MSDISKVRLYDYTIPGMAIFNWLGSFWTQTFSDPEFVGATHRDGLALLEAQLYLDFVETLQLLDRNNAPVFHREHWYPLIIKDTDTNTGTGALITTYMDPPPVIGPQEYDSGYTPNTVFKIGGYAEYEHLTSYPLPTNMTQILTVICDNPVAPTIVLTRDKEFFVENNTLFILKQYDPFLTGTFPTRESTTTEGEPANEAMLWLCDATFDRDYVYKHIGYVLGIATASEVFYKKLLNAIWTLYNNGATMSLLQSALGAILGEPTALTTGEVVTAIETLDSGKHIITDTNVYVISANATVIVTAGDTLTYGDFLTDAVKVYTNVDPLNDSSPFRTDVQSLFIPPAMMTAVIQQGLGLDWEPTDLICVGDNANGDPKFEFAMSGTAVDQAAFWSAHHAYCEANAVAPADYFAEYLYQGVDFNDGVVSGRIAPAEYFLRYCFRNNWFFVVVNRDHLADQTRMSSTILLSTIKQVVPAHIMFTIIEWRELASEYDLADNVSDAVEQAWGVTTSGNMLHSVRPTARKSALTYYEPKPTIMWKPTCN